ncbi:MAG: hypothetical protein QGD89_08375 [Actinomycetota bacterium]|nr:hypothetical protein [Actinomycetota bacterium]
MKKIIVSIAAAGVIVAGAFVVATIASSEASAQADEAPVVTEEARRSQRVGILDEVLGTLVADGTLTRDQADAVKDALGAKRAELKESFGDRREQRARGHRIRARVEEWLEDGVITPDELSQLPQDAPIFADDGPLADALEDGVITQAEWDAFVEQRRTEHEARRGTREISDGS